MVCQVCGAGFVVPVLGCQVWGAGLGCTLHRLGSSQRKPPQLRPRWERSGSRDSPSGATFPPSGNVLPQQETLGALQPLPGAGLPWERARSSPEQEHPHPRQGLESRAGSASHPRHCSHWISHVGERKGTWSEPLTALRGDFCCQSHSGLEVINKLPGESGHRMGKADS